MFGFHRRDVRWWEWDTVFPNPGTRPVTWDRADNGVSFLVTVGVLSTQSVMKMVFMSSWAWDGVAHVDGLGERSQ